MYWCKCLHPVPAYEFRRGFCTLVLFVIIIIESHTKKDANVEVKGGKRHTFKKMTRKRYNLRMEKENHSKDDMIL